MIIFAQAGLGGVAGAAGALIQLFGLLFGLGPLFLLLLWYLPETIQFLIDTIRRRDFLAESEHDRLMEGRILARGYKL